MAIGSQTLRIRASSTTTIDRAPELALAFVPALLTAIAFVELPAWIRMWLLAATIFFAFKLLTWRRAIVAGQVPALGRSLAYLLAWPGMDAEMFLSDEKPPSSPTVSRWCEAIFKTSLGLGLVGVAATVLRDSHPTLAAWTALVGLIFLLHCGLFHVLALVWQSRGVTAVPIMDRPFLATSLADFWSRRWNTAFHQLADYYVYRPLLKRTSPGVAIAIVFLASGVIHDLVITVPAGGGYGLPTLYFLLQAAAILLARSAIGRRMRWHRGWRARLSAAVVLIAPLPLLCPQPFREHVVLPMLVDLRWFLN
ncbi:MAG: membrane bound O-acyl transferase family-domain-containing protein [Pirellulales bacterium]